MVNPQQVSLPAVVRCGPRRAKVRKRGYADHLAKFSSVESMITNISVADVWVKDVELTLVRDNSGNWIVLVEPREFTPEDFA